VACRIRLEAAIRRGWVVLGVQPLRLILKGTARSASSVASDVVDPGRLVRRGSDFAGAMKRNGVEGVLGDVVVSSFSSPAQASRQLVTAMNPALVRRRPVCELPVRDA